MDYPGKVITKTQVTPTQTSASGNWTLDDQAAAIKNNNWPVALVPNPISKSLRFNSADTAYLNRTFGTSTNQSIFTYSVWVKLGRTVEATTNYGSLLSGYAASSDTGFAEFHFYNGTLRFGGWATNWRVTTQLFRDPSSWYHVILAVDTTQATAANRVKMYVNGSEITAFFTNNNPTQNSTVGINNNSTTGRIGQDAPASSSRLFDGYMAEANFIDGQALTPSDFGLTNPQTGQWIPKKYTGTYGTNGFYLNFKDATSTTTLGYDYSGNANNWTTNNFSVTAGSGNDSLTDVPTPWVAYNTTGDVGGVFRGNYATYNSVGSAPSVTLTNGNLDASHGAFTTTTGAASTFGVSSGKWYWEVTINAISSGAPFIGIVRSDQLYPFTTFFANNSQGYAYRSTGVKRNNGSDTAYGASYTNGDVIGVALDMDAGTIVFYKNNTSQGTAFSSLSGTFIPIDGNGTSGGTYTSTINFGQRPFAYTPPAGFRSLCTTNLPATTIGFGLTNQAGKYFNAVLYTGTGSNLAVTGVGFQPDLLWIKQRSSTESHTVFDAVRGVDIGLTTNTTAAEVDFGVAAQLSFDSDGFTLGTNGRVNTNTSTFVAWNWKAGGTGVTNTAGSITSTVSASTTAGFSIVTYTGTGSNATVGHGLGVAPRMIIAKRRNAVENWPVYHAVPGPNQYAYLDVTQAFSAASSVWQNVTPTSTVFSIGTSATTNASGGTYVAYCFAAVPGYSAFGSYTGNGSTDGPFVYTGFRPRYVMIKRTDSTSDWTVWDTARNTYNTMNLALYPDLSNAEVTTSIVIDTVSNGIKIRNSNADTNASGGTYIYAAFAEYPFQFANAR